MSKLVVAIAAITLVGATSSAPSKPDVAAQLFARGDFTEAAAAYEAALQRNPADADAKLALGAIRLFENDRQSAEPLLDAVLDADPHNARATHLLAELQRRDEEAARQSSVAGGETVVPFVTGDPLPVVRASADGVSANFLVDTGGDVALEPSFAAKLGVQTHSAGSGTFAGGRQAAISGGMLKSLSLGGATAHDVPVHVFPTHAGELIPNMRIAGVSGTTYFERFLVTIDYPHHALVLRPRAASAAFEQRAAATGATTVPCYLVGDHFVIAPAQVNDAPGGLFLFDSGLAGGGVMPSTELLDAAKITLDRTQASTGIGGGGAITAVPFVVRRVAVGSAVQYNVAGIYTPQGSPFGLFPFTVWGAISDKFLRNYAYTVDFDAMKLVLQAQATAAPAPATSQQPPQSAQRIVDEAFRRLQSYPVPPYAVFTDTWHTTSRPMGYYTGENTSVDVNRYAVRLEDGMENTTGGGPHKKLPPAIISPQFLGPFAWTLRTSVHPPPAAANPDAAAMAPDTAGLKTIASVVAVAKPSYTVGGAAGDAVPVENVDGHQCYHLTLHPNDDPEKHNLRDLWIDVQTYDLWKAHFVGKYRPVPGAPISPTDVTVYFRNVVGCWVVAHAIWTYQDSPISYKFDVTTDEIALPKTLPGWLFDQSEYDQHVSAGEPDYLGNVLEQMRSGS